MSLTKEDLAAIGDVVDSKVTASEKRLRGEMTASDEQQRVQMTSLATDTHQINILRQELQDNGALPS